MFSPRWYQHELIEGTRQAWSMGAQNVLIVSPPRSGKTPIMVWLSEPSIAANQHVCIMVHREELVRQIAMTYADFGYEHTLVAPDDVVRSIIQRQIKEYGRSFVRQNALITVGSVQTINARAEKMTQWANRVSLWMCDESHHLLADNQWGKVAALFTSAKGAGFTATPGRTDRKSLARSQGGVFDVMVKGVTARQLIDEGHICEYRIIAPPSSIDREAIRTGAKGEFVQKGVSEATKHSTITGDCVSSYQKFTPGEQAVVFAVDIEHSNDMCKEFVAAGIAAETVSSKTPKLIRKQLMDKFERGVFKVLINVDLFGEGLNVLGISVVIMARPTKSFVLYTQQFFRALTKADGKHLGTIIDHVGNVGYFGKFYGLPDTYNNWTLESEERGRRTTRDPDVMPVTTCVKCFNPYEATTPACPFCGHSPEPEGRSRPEQVDGDLIELDVETLRALRDVADGRVGTYPYEVNSPREAAMRNNWNATSDSQVTLRETIALWAGMRRDGGDTDSMIYRRFFHTFGTDVMSAQNLTPKAADVLRGEITKRTTI